MPGLLSQTQLASPCMRRWGSVLWESIGQWATNLESGMTSAGGIAWCVPLVSPLIHRSSSQRSGTHPHVSAQWDQAVRFFGLSTDVTTPLCHVPQRDANGRRPDRTCGDSSRLLFRLAELKQEPN